MNFVGIVVSTFKTWVRKHDHFVGGGFGAYSDLFGIHVRSSMYGAIEARFKCKVFRSERWRARTATPQEGVCSVVTWTQVRTSTLPAHQLQRRQTRLTAKAFGVQVPCGSNYTINIRSFESRFTADSNGPVQRPFQDGGLCIVTRPIRCSPMLPACCCITIPFVAAGNMYTSLTTRTVMWSHPSMFGVGCHLDRVIPMRVPRGSCVTQQHSFRLCVVVSAVWPSSCSVH